MPASVLVRKAPYLATERFRHRMAVACTFHRHLDGAKYAVRRGLLPPLRRVSIFSFSRRPRAARGWQSMLGRIGWSSAEIAFGLVQAADFGGCFRFLITASASFYICYIGGNHIYFIMPRHLATGILTSSQVI